MTRILVTGGCGFIGSNLCRTLLENNDNYIICMDNLVTGNLKNIEPFRKNPHFRFVRHNVIDPYDFHVDKIYNLACPASPVAYQQDPVFTSKTSYLGIINALENAKKYNAKLLQASTSEIYGDAHISPQTEKYWGNVNPIGLRACYDEGKRAAEELMFDWHRKYGTKIKVVRIFNTYGPNMAVDDGRVISNFIVQALQDKDITIYGNGNQTRSFCFIDDLLKGLIAMMDSDSDFTGPVNLGNPAEITVKELADCIVGLTDSKSGYVNKPLPSDDPVFRKPDITLAHDKLNFCPQVSLEEGLKKTIDYFRNLLSENQRTPICNKTIKKLANRIITDSDRNLIELLFGKDTVQKDLDDFLENWDIEAEGSYKALLLAYFIKDRKNNLSPPPYVKPRLDGLINFYRFHNVKLISQFVRLVKEYGKCNADILIMKGGTMKHLRPDYPRIMSDIDILPDRKHFKQLISITKKLGYRTIEAGHSIDVHSAQNEPILDIHRYISIGFFKGRLSKRLNEDFFRRSTEQNVFGLKLRIPSNEDLVFMTIMNMVRNLMWNSGLHGIVFNLSDIQYLISGKKDFNWNVVIEDIRKTKTEIRYCFGQTFINTVIPDCIPDLKNKIGDAGSIDRKTEKFCIVKKYYDLYVSPLAHKRDEANAAGEKTVRQFLLRWKCRFLNIPVYFNSSILAGLLLKLRKEKF